MVKIDYIIPTYNKSNIVSKALECLCKQSMKDSLCITLVNDCSPNTDCNYQDLINEYKDRLDIRVIKTPKNVGTGMARQFGIDNTTHPYIMFQDDDDILASEYAIEAFVEEVEKADESVISIVSGWKETDKEGNILAEKSGRDMCTCIVRLIYRNILDKYEIKFDSDMSMVFEDKDFGMKYLYILNKYGYTEKYLNKNYYVYIRDNEFSTMNNTSVYKTDLYHAILKFKEYKFKQEHEENDNVLWNILNEAFELSFFSIIRNIVSPGISKNDLTLLRNIIEENYDKLGDEYEIQENSIIYNLKDLGLLNNVEENYNIFLSNPFELIDALMEKIQ